MKRTPWVSRNPLTPYSQFRIHQDIKDSDGNYVAHVPVSADFQKNVSNARLISAAPELLAALEATIIPLMRLGDFIGNTDEGGASGLGPFDRCSIILQVKEAIEKAKGEQS